MRVRIATDGGMHVEPGGRCFATNLADIVAKANQQHQGRRHSDGGLKLESTRGPVDVVVIDHVDRATGD